MGAKVLSRERFLEVAVDYADRGGLEGLTLRQLGEVLGVDATAVYRYFRSKSDLLVAVLGLKLDEAIAAEHAEGLEHRPPVERLEHLMLATRSVLMAYPALARNLAGVRVAPSVNNEMTLAGWNAIAEMGFEPREALLRYQMLESYVIGAALFDGAGHPHNWEIRAKRYRRSGVAAGREVGRSPDEVREFTEVAFRRGVAAMLSALEAEAPQQA